MSLAKIKNRLRQYIKESGMSESALSEAADLGTSFITGILSQQDRDPGVAKLQKVCDVLGIPLAALFADDVIYQDGSILISELDVRASAGHGCINGEEVVLEHKWAIPREYLATRKIVDPTALRVIEVCGDSMAPEYQPSDKILVDTAVKVPGDGDYVIVGIFGELQVKTLQPASTEVIRVISKNPSYPILERIAEEVIVCGKVVGKWLWK
jgi:transcriptional regulator with XRE-family HTH domain